MAAIKQLVLAAVLFFTTFVSAGPVASRRVSALTTIGERPLEWSVTVTVSSPVETEVKREEPITPIDLPPRMLTPPSAVKRTSDTCEVCDTVCINDSGSLDQSCVDSCELTRSMNDCDIMTSAVKRDSDACDIACILDDGSINQSCIDGCVLPPSLDESDATPSAVKRDSDACDIACILDDGSINQSCIDGCVLSRSIHHNAVSPSKRQAVTPTPVIPDCSDCNTACVNAANGTYFDCLVTCEGKNSGNCAHTPKRQVTCPANCKDACDDLKKHFPSYYNECLDNCAGYVAQFCSGS